MLPDQLYLEDFIEAASAVQRFLSDAPKESFLLSEIEQGAVLQKLIVIGETAARVSTVVRTAYPQIPWQDIVAFRNIAVHAYFSVDWEIVWHTATNDVPALKNQIEAILHSEFDNNE